MYNTIVRSYINGIKQDFELSKQIIKHMGTENRDIVEFVNNSTVIAMCIKYETFTTDLLSHIKNRQMSYNHPWANSRVIAKKMNINIDREYKNAHDAWDYYNSLKHVNSHSKLEAQKFTDEHNLQSSWDALKFTYHALIELLEKFADSK